MTQVDPAEQPRPAVRPDLPVEFRKLDVTVRETDYVAGRANLTAVVIRNTYPLPIKLISVTASHSTINSRSDSSVYKGSIATPLRPSSTRVKISIPSLFFPFGRKTGKPLFELTHSISSAVEAEPIFINADKGTIITIDDKISPDREINIEAKEGAIINFANANNDNRAEMKVTDISSMSEVVSEYTWETKNWLLFIPSRIGIDIEIKYKIVTEIRSQVVSTIFDIKPPAESLLFGGIAGGIIGSLARAFTDAANLRFSLAFFAKLIGSSLLSVMAVVSLSRKSGSQAFITVEDFFGAFVLGSLIGYEGVSFFEKTVANGPGASTQIAPK